MTQTYETRRRARNAPAANKSQTAAPGPSLQELAAGARPSTEQMGRRVDLPEAVREKMENSFGADFSGVKLYESQTVADAGAEAMTMGNNVAFAPGKLDLTGTAGQALLGHELSHVVSQSRGESAGRGFLRDAGLEAQADRQGILAAQGESVYSGPVSPIGASSAVSASGPMQAKKKKDVAQDALAKGAEGDLPEGMDKDVGKANEVMAAALAARNSDGMRTNGTRLQDSDFYNYASRRVAAMQDEEARGDFLDFMLSASDEEINKYIKKDVLDTAVGMTKASEGLISEDFNTRANAYAESGSHAGHAKAIQNDFYIMKCLLNEEEQAVFNNAAENFRGDRQSAMYSMRAYSPDADDRSTRAGEDQRGLRKRYRNQRREGNIAKRLLGNRERQAEPSLSPSWELQRSEFI